MTVLSEMHDHSREETALARLAYERAAKQHRLADHRRVTYRCPERCLLLDVLQFPDPVGIVVHKPRYRYSPKVNAESSNEAGRRKNTLDGDRRWKAQTFPIQYAANFVLNCDHLHHVTITVERVEGDIVPGWREMTVTEADDSKPG